ncbi:MAG: c-type cytochrome [Bryobacteraceae bacterium]|nr:c-type cytochrome [Bryobacteraceae bacterium]MDW8378831.1 c-type cytochrome [Bryobacterales bacterium]
MKRWVVCLVVGVVAACSKPSSGSKPLSAEASLKAAQLSEDFHLELFAAEPLVLDPVDMVFDEDGRAYVADMLDLPWDPPPGKPARSRIVLLEDSDGDGKADKSTVFAENVLQVSGLAVWKGGLIVPSAPHIYYMKDTDGDGRADVREILFTGFFQGNPEAQITNPRYAIDNWIYFANTGNAGRITSPKWPHLPAVQVRGMDFRFHPSKHLAQPASGSAQYGLSFDDWGNRFISQNTQHLRHVVVEMKYLLRAPLLEVSTFTHDPYGKRERRMYPLTPPEPWRVERTKLRQKRYDELQTGRVEHATGYMSGATGGTVYTGDAWPEEYRGSIFTGDVSGNLVRRDILSPEGVSFVARPAKDNVEFLASTDPWFRPTCFANAPDGNLYMMDIYRQVIETPLSIPEELQKRLKLDFYRGDDRGRIYRIVSNKPRHQRPLRVRLSHASSADLVDLLGHDNGWHRLTAQRLLVERQDKSVTAKLRELARSEKPLARLHALWTLEGLGVLELADVLTALKDSHAGIREHAVRLSESLPPSAELERALIARSADVEIRVRLQTAFTLGAYSSAAAKNAIVALAVRDGDNPWMRIATLSAAYSWPGEFLSKLGSAKAAGNRELLRAVGSLVGARRQSAEIRALLSDARRLSSAQILLEGLARGLELSRVDGAPLPGFDAELQPLVDARDPSVQRAAWEVARNLSSAFLQARAMREAFDEKVPLPTRTAMVSCWRGIPLESALALVRKLFATNPPSSLQAAAVDVLASYRNPEATRALLAAWKSYSPEARVRAVAGMLSQKERVAVLLEAIEKREVDPAALEINARNRLLEEPDPALAARARKIFASATGDRAQIVEQFRDVLSLPGDPTRGKLAFEEHCARCHAARKQGARVGPDLRGVNNKSKEELLEAILNPSRSIEPRFVNYVVTTKNGQMYDGVLVNETPGTITLRSGPDEDVTLLRSQIQEIRSSTISLMPEEFEKSLSKQALADVIAFLRAGL